MAEGPKPLRPKQLAYIGGAGALFGLLAGTIVGIHRYREAFGLGSLGLVAVLVVVGMLGSGDEKWGWVTIFVFANVLSYAVFLGLGCATRGLLNRVKAA